MALYVIRNECKMCIYGAYSGFLTISAQLEKQRLLATQQRQSRSALVRPGQKFAQPVKTPQTECDKPDSALIKKQDTRVLQSTPSTLEQRPTTAPAASRLKTLSPIRSASSGRQEQTMQNTQGTDKEQMLN